MILLYVLISVFSRIMGRRRKKKTVAPLVQLLNPYTNVRKKGKSEEKGGSTQHQGPPTVPEKPKSVTLPGTPLKDKDCVASRSRSRTPVKQPDSSTPQARSASAKPGGKERGSSKAASGRSSSAGAASVIPGQKHQKKSDTAPVPSAKKTKESVPSVTSKVTTPSASATLSVGSASAKKTVASVEDDDFDSGSEKEDPTDKEYTPEADKSGEQFGELDKSSDPDQEPTFPVVSSQRIPKGRGKPPQRSESELTP